MAEEEAAAEVGEAEEAAEAAVVAVAGGGGGGGGGVPPNWMCTVAPLADTLCVVNEMFDTGSKTVWPTARAESMYPGVPGVASISCDWTIWFRLGPSRSVTPLTTASSGLKLSYGGVGCRNSR